MMLHQKVLGLHERQGFISNHKDELAQVATRREEAHRNADTRLLQVLWFPKISHRYVEIEEAYKKHLHGFSRTTLINSCALFLQSPGRVRHKFSKWLGEQGTVLDEREGGDWESRHSCGTSATTK